MPETIQIIASCIRGDENAFRSLFRRYADFAFRVAFRIMHDEEESKDVVQESFITVWDRIRDFEPDRKFSNWLYRIVVNKCFDALRKKKRMQLVYPGAGDWNLMELTGENGPDNRLENEETGRIIRRLTYSLSPKQKIVFVLSELEGLSHADISDITGMGKTSVKSNLHHARRKIGEQIKKYI